MRNETLGIDEDKQPSSKSEPSKHLKNNPAHKFHWMTLPRALSQHLNQNILRAYFIKQLNLSPNDNLADKY